MRFSIDQESVNEIISMLTEYRDDINTEFRTFLDEIKTVAIKTNYNKLLYALQGIVDLYNKTVCGSMRENLISKWLDEGESLHSFAEDLYMGEESEFVARQIENSIENIFIFENFDEFLSLKFNGDSNINNDDFNDIIMHFDTFEKNIESIKNTYLNDFTIRIDENELYRFLLPIVESVSVSITSFVNASKEKLSQLEYNYNTKMRSAKEQVEESKKNSKKLEFDLDLFDFDDFKKDLNDKGTAFNVSQMGKNDGDNSKKTKNTEKINNEIVKELTKYAFNMATKSQNLGIEEFKKLTEYLYRKISNEAYTVKKKLTYDLIAQLMTVYQKFYSEFGDYLTDHFNSYDEKYKFISKEYLGVTNERGNFRYFSNDDDCIFKSHAFNTYTVFDRVSIMLKNIANECKKGNANDTNLIYGAYVLFTPILNGYIDKEDFDIFSEFNKWAADEILKIIGKESLIAEYESLDIKFKGEKFDEENINLAVAVVEKIVNKIGVETFNILVSDNYDVLTESRKVYEKFSQSGFSKQAEKSSQNYGRYTVSNESIRMMSTKYEQINSVLAPIDKFYKDKFESLDRNFENVNSTIHNISSFLGLWGLGSWNLSKLFSVEDSDETIFKKIQLGGIALSSRSFAGKIINGGAHMLKIMDWAMPHFKKSKILVNLSEKVWNLTRKDIQIPYYNKKLDLYILEHYEIKYGYKKDITNNFSYFHKVAISIQNDLYRRVFENSIFAAEIILSLKKYHITETEPLKNRAICCGIFLNLVRSAMECKLLLKSSTSNDIVDKLYEIYYEKEGVVPRVELNPMKRKLP